MVGQSAGAVASKVSWRDLHVKRSTWQPRRQHIVAIWVKEFITDLGVIPNASGPIKLFCDNTRAIALANEPRFHKKTRHIKASFQLHP